MKGLVKAFLISWIVSVSCATFVRAAEVSPVKGSTATFVRVQISSNTNSASPIGKAKFFWSTIGSTLTISYTNGIATTTIGTHNEFGVVGTQTNDNALASTVIGYSSAAASTAFQNAPTSTQFANIRQITLGPGDWILSGSCGHSGSTPAQIGCAISAFSGNSTGDHVQGQNLNFAAPPTASYDSFVAITNWRVSISATTTYYIKGRSDYASGTPTFRGSILAIRIR
jgi:hypothetical protein